MDKKHVKLAVIRTSEESPCPFGLKIPYACRNVGGCIERMAPLDILGEDAEEGEIVELAKANQTLMLMDADGDRCPFAGKVFKDKDAVECNYGSNAEGVNPDRGLTPSPFYSKVYENIAYDGAYSYPLGWFGENNISRNTYYGIYSLQGEERHKNVKTAAYHKDIIDAIDHALEVGDELNDGEYYFKIEPTYKIPINDLFQWEDIQSWLEIDWGELYDLTPKEIKPILNKFRPGYGDLAMKWIKAPNNAKLPPIILVELLNGSQCVGDGRGRVNIAAGMGLANIPVVILRQVESDGDVTVYVKNNQVQGGFLRTAAVLDLSEKLKEKEQKDILNKLKSSQPGEIEPTTQQEFEKAQDKRLFSDLAEETGVWMHRFSDVRKDDEGFYILKSDNPAGKNMAAGQLLADLAMNQTPYWSITSIVGDRINLRPIGKNPFATGVGAGGAKLTDYDVSVFSGDYEKKRVQNIQNKLEKGTAVLDDIIYILEGTVPVNMGPNGSQGGWYSCTDRYSNRGGKKGMSAKDIMISDANKLKELGFSVPIKALSGELDPGEWDYWISSNGNHKLHYKPKNIDKYLEFAKKKTEQGKWNYSPENIESDRSKFENMSEEDIFATEGEDNSIESILKNIFNKERRVAIRNVLKLIELCKEDNEYVKYLHDFIKMGGSDWYANEQVLYFFDLEDDVEGLKLACKHLTDADNRRYALGYLARKDPAAAAEELQDNDYLSSYRGLLGNVISQAENSGKEDKAKIIDWVINIAEKYNLIERIKEDWEDTHKKYEAEELLATLRRAVRLTGAYYLDEEWALKYFPKKVVEFAKTVREL